MGKLEWNKTFSASNETNDHCIAVCSSPSTFTLKTQIQFKIKAQEIGCAQESRREGWTDAAIMLCKLNKSL